ncbi:hypothetical protein BEL04_11790 [Mucilaginibacter sp. PPCGB 2223]|uniref:hypothetical protein n=1 Tax=Mucilaginibacter sp. PPCGB 2223 TaxID=1886027 RepID=UPI00082562AF|nr:hypothetical protein [Mucilaginibacter sp. PPCGB 2223]OCX52164.1 hypothetical protein BEL04_11790 [Mucilaginibacter sp. PPCGB 2223]
MKKIKYIIIMLVVLSSAAIIMPGCMKLQKDFTRSTTDTLDAHLNKTAWAYLKSRAYQNATPSDTLFRRMYDAIIYSGIDTNEYIKPNRTYLFLNQAAAKAVWAGVFTSANKAGTSWKSYPAADVKNYLQYLILQGQYTHYNLPVYDVVANTLLAPGTYATNPVNFKFNFTSAPFIPNPTSTMTIKVLNASPSNTSDYPIQLNGSMNVNTSDLLATNGVVDVMSVAVNPNLPQ